MRLYTRKQKQKKYILSTYRKPIHHTVLNSLIQFYSWTMSSAGHFDLSKKHTKWHRTIKLASALTSTLLYAFVSTLSITFHAAPSPLSLSLYLTRSNSLARFVTHQAILDAIHGSKNAYGMFIFANR